MNWSWLRRRWWDFRHGHGTYLAYALSFANFIIITYTLLLSNIPQLYAIFSHLWIYALVFLMFYPPLAILIGYREFRKKQYPTDVDVATRQNPFLWKLTPGKEQQLTYPLTLLRLQLDLKLWQQFNLLSSEEKREFECLIAQIEKLMRGETIK